VHQSLQLEWSWQWPDHPAVGRPESDYNLLADIPVQEEIHSPAQKRAIIRAMAGSGSV